MDFDATSKAILERHGFKQRTPDELVEWWANLIEQCVDGYDWTIYEFDDEMSVRDYIETLLDDPSLEGFNAFNEFKARVARLDEQYRELLQGDVKRPSKLDFWWRTGVLRYAGDEYCEDMSSRYSISVEVYDE